MAYLYCCSFISKTIKNYDPNCFHEFSIDGEWLKVTTRIWTCATLYTKLIET